MSESAHAGKTVTCRHPDDDSIDDPTELTFEDHGRYVKHPRGEDAHGGDLRDRFEQSALRFDCPDCGRTYWKCPVCSDPDENTAPGYFRGESTGEAMPCHNCNQEEIARRRRHHGHAGKMGSRRR